MGLNHAQPDQCSCLKCFDPFLKSRVKQKTTDINGLKFHTCLSKLLHVGWAIKQLFHGCLVNSQNLSPSVPRTPWTSRCTIALGLWPRAVVHPSLVPWGYRYYYSPNNHEITVYYCHQKVSHIAIHAFEKTEKYIIQLLTIEALDMSDVMSTWEYQ